MWGIENVQTHIVLSKQTCGNFNVLPTHLICISSRNFTFMSFKTCGRSKGALGTRAPSIQMFSFSCSFFFAKMFLNNRLAYPHLGLATPTGKSWISHWIRVLDRVSYQYMILHLVLDFETRLHSSSMRTDRCSGDHWMSVPQGSACRAGSASKGYPTHPVNRLTDRRLWKHYLPYRQENDNEYIGRLAFTL